MLLRSFRRPAAPGFLCGLCFFAVSLAVSGCDSGSSPTVATITTVYDLATGLAQAFCDHQACCGVAGDASVPLDGSVDAAATGSPAPGASCVADGGTVALDASTGTGTGSSCQSRALYAISEQLALVSTAAAEGLLAISPTAATACIAAYQS